MDTQQEFDHFFISDSSKALFPSAHTLSLAMSQSKGGHVISEKPAQIGHRLSTKKLLPSSSSSSLRFTQILSLEFPQKLDLISIETFIGVKKRA
jgi:hypothetical protein